MATISDAEFDARFREICPALLAHARRHVGTQDADDVLSEVYLNALQSIRDRRFTDRVSEGYLGAFANWMYRITTCACAAYNRQRYRRQEHEVSLEGFSREEVTEMETYLASLEVEAQRGESIDLELQREALLRLQYADLTPQEAFCLKGRLEAKNWRELKKAWRDLYPQAAALSPATITRRIQSAVRKLRDPALAEFCAAMQSPDRDRHGWKVSNPVTIYHAPTSMGAKLWRESLAKMTLPPLRAKP